MSAVFDNILDLLKKPNFDDAMSLEKAHLYRENPDNYRRQAEAHSNKYGENDVNKLKRQHQLEDHAHSSTN
jgi:ubiquitin-protein ligase